MYPGTKLWARYVGICTLTPTPNAVVPPQVAFNLLVLKRPDGSFLMVHVMGRPSPTASPLDSSVLGGPACSSLHADVTIRGSADSGQPLRECMKAGTQTFAGLFISPLHSLILLPDTATCDGGPTPTPFPCATPGPCPTPGPVTSSLDSDHDGFPDSTEAFLGTDPTQACGPNSWPPDINNDGKVTLSDVLAYSPSFNSAVTSTSYDARLDLNDDGRVNLSDVLGLSPYFNKACSAQTP
jgi:hypothetical protein